MRIGHVQLAMPKGHEDEARRFFRDVLQMEEMIKPARLRSAGGCWFRASGCEVHVGVDPDFRAQRKAHPCFVVSDLDTVVERLRGAGARIDWDDRIPGVTRFYTADPFGNRLEFQAP